MTKATVDNSGHDAIKYMIFSCKLSIIMVPQIVHFVYKTQH